MLPEWILISRKPELISAKWVSIAAELVHICRSWVPVFMKPRLKPASAELISANGGTNKASFSINFVRISSHFVEMGTNFLQTGTNLGVS